MRLLTVSRCVCGKSYIPVRAVCPSCGSRTQSVEIEGKGRILTYTTLYSVPDGFKAPLHIALVELSDGTKLICKARTAALKIDKEVNVEPRDDIYQLTVL